MTLRIAALLTCHNRREMTVACLRSLRAQILPGWNPGGSSGWQVPGGEERKESQRDISPEHMAQSPAFDTSNSRPITRHSLPNRYVIEVYLVDDGSTDGTAEAAREIWPEAKIIQGDGNLYWCGGMRLAWAEAARTDPHYYLLLNDDTLINSDAISELLALAPSPDEEVIAVAPIADPDTGDVFCGGHQGHAPRPVIPSGHPAVCSTMNANCVIVPNVVFKKIGMFHEVYTHAMGDLDYGFLATRNGICVIQAGKVLGKSKPNSPIKTWRDTSLPRRERFRHLWKHPKGLPFREWATYCRRNHGALWPLRSITPALRIVSGW